MSFSPPNTPDPSPEAGETGTLHPAGAPPDAAGRSVHPGRDATRSRVRLATLAGESLPPGASLIPPVPAPLPERGAAVFFLVSLTAAVVSVVFAILIASKL